jgi:hypothetical protein
MLYGEQEVMHVRRALLQLRLVPKPTREFSPHGYPAYLHTTERELCGGEAAQGRRNMTWPSRESERERERERV